MCLPPQSKPIQRVANVSAAVAAAAAAAAPKQPEVAYVPPPMPAAAYVPQQMYASYYHPSAMYQQYAPAYPKYAMEEPTMFEALPFADAGLNFAEMPEMKEVVPAAVDPMDFSWLYGRAPTSGSPPSAVPEMASSPFEDGAYYPSVDVSPYSSEEPSDEHSPAYGTPATGGRKQRKRKLASDLTPEELTKTREINRLAAQRHRHIAKQKQSERQERYDAMGSRNDKLRQEIQQITTELNTLKRLVVSMYGNHGPRHTALISHMALPPMTVMRIHS